MIYEDTIINTTKLCTTKPTRLQINPAIDNPLKGCLISFAIFILLYVKMSPNTANINPRIGINIDNIPNVKEAIA